MKLCPRGRIFSHIPKCSAAGEAMFIQYGCGSCHALKNMREATGLVGPPLDGLRVIVGGHLANNPDNMQRWIRDQQHASPDTAMPDLNSASAMRATSPPSSTPVRNSSGGVRIFFPVGRRDADELSPASLAPAPPPPLHNVREPPGPVMSKDAAQQTSDHRPAPLTQHAGRLAFSH